MSGLFRITSRKHLNPEQRSFVMRKQLAVLAAAAAMAVGGIGFYSATARADDPAGNPPPTGTDRAGGYERDTTGRQQSPAAADVRSVVSEATSAAVQGKFSDALKRFTEADRKRLGDQF